MLSDFKNKLNNMTKEEKEEGFKEFTAKAKEIQEDNKNSKKGLLILISIGLFMTLILLSGISYKYFSHQLAIKAQAVAEEKQKEETRFITVLDNQKTISGSSIVEVLNNVLQSTRWSQSQVSDNTWQVECIGDLNGSTIAYTINATDNGTDIDPTFSFNTAKYSSDNNQMTTKYSSNIILALYYSNTGKTIPDNIKTDIDKINRTFAIFESIDTDYKTSIDPNYIFNTYKANDKAYKLSTEIVDACISNKLNYTDITTVFICTLSSKDRALLFGNFNLKSDKDNYQYFLDFFANVIMDKSVTNIVQKHNDQWNATD